MNKTDKEIGKFLRAKRIKAGMTQLEVSRLLGYDSMQFVSLFERGLSKVPMKALGQLSVIFGFSPFPILNQIIDAQKQEMKEEIFNGKSIVAKTKTA